MSLAQIVPPQVLQDLTLQLPLLIISLGALSVMLLEVFLPKNWPRAELTVVTLLAALLAVVMQTPSYTQNLTVFNGALFVDPFAAFITVVILLGAVLSLMIGVNRLTSEGIESKGEFYALYLIATAGSILFATASELITLFLGLETMSLALYCLCGSAIGIRRSTEAALKYFLLGSFSSAFLLFGIALLYGGTGTTQITELPVLLDRADKLVLFTAMGMMLIGLVFKIGGVPFHFWAPDVYEGSPTQVTAYMACVIKAASVATGLRIMWSVFGADIVFWSSAVWYIAFFTMVVGNIVALRQRGVKRMLAYSSIAHAGYMMVGFLATGDQFGGGAAILYYLVSYTAMTIGSFAIVMIISEPYLKERFPDDINRFNGLGYRRPVVAALMSLFLLSLAGLPPGMAGLLGKVFIFSAAVKADYIGLTIVGVLSSAVSCYYYLYVIVRMYFVDGGEGETIKSPIGIPMGSALALCSLGVVLLGVFPSVLYQGVTMVIQSSQLLH